MRMASAAEWRPGGSVFVKVDTRRNLVYLIGPVAGFDSRFASFGGKNARNSRAMREQMGQKPVLLEETFAIAHRSVMALDEDAGASRGDYSGRGKWAWARGEDVCGFAQLGKLGQKRAQPGERERRPVGLYQRAVHAVRFGR